jgi:uncharacterized membrane protein
MDPVSRTFISGVAALLPIVITIALLYWLGVTAEALLGGLIRFAIPEGYYVPGLGVIVAVVAILLIGILTRNFLVRTLFDWSGALFARIPVVKSIYGALKDFSDLMSSDRREQLGRVAVIDVPGLPGRLVGFLTRERCTDLPAPLDGEDIVAIYLPLSYQIGGYTLLVPRSAVTPIEMSVEDALRFTLTAGMSLRGQVKVASRASSDGEV